MTMTKKTFTDLVARGHWRAFFPDTLNAERAIILVSVKEEDSPYTDDYAVFGVSYPRDSEDQTAAILSALESASDPVKVRAVFGMGSLSICNAPEKAMTSEAFLTKLEYGSVRIANVPGSAFSPYRKTFIVKDFEGHMWGAVASFDPKDPIGTAVKELREDGDSLELMPVEWKEGIVNYIPA